MRHCSKPVRLTTIAAVLALFAGLSVSPRAVAQSKAPDPQKPLTVDRDPVVSPDSADNQPGPEIRPPSVRTSPGSSNSLSKGDHGYTLRRDVEEVVLNVTVLDDHNKLVMNLTKPDFSVAEDGVAQTIISFQHEDIPVSMGILVDNSGSMRDKRQAVKFSAALDLVKALKQRR